MDCYDWKGCPGTCDACEIGAEMGIEQEKKGNSGRFGPYIFGMDMADGFETTVVSRMNPDGTITVLDACRRPIEDSNGHQTVTNEKGVTGE